MLKEIINKEKSSKEEKKVEYIELIYDLIFVYIIGRNNHLLHNLENGFFSLNMYITYLATTFIILQIWYFTTLFINRYGSNGPAEHICLFINMYLMYYMGQGTSALWRHYYVQYNIAWSLILLNLAVQYYLVLRKSPDLPDNQRGHIIFNICLLIGEAVLVAVSIPIFSATGAALSPIALVVGLTVSLTVGRSFSRGVPVDFPHLSERVMLYVVFTFGEMIIGIAGYFSDTLNSRTIYFSLMGFLIVAGLFSMYGYFYDHIIDRERVTAGTAYMMIHILLISSLNNITTALEFMREESVDEVKKNAFLTISLVIYFVFLMLTLTHSKSYHKHGAEFFGVSALLTALFVTSMAMFYKDSVISILATVTYIYSMLIMNNHFSHKETIIAHADERHLILTPDKK